MQESLYHVFLRTSALTLALVLLFVSGIISPFTKELATDTSVYLASAIGINAAVMPTEINTLSAQLQQRDLELTQREIAVSLKEEKGNPDMTTFVLSVVLFLLLVLIVLNYVLDFMRTRSLRNVGQPYEKAA
jgi:hypothetical protein